MQKIDLPDLSGARGSSGGGGILTAAGAKKVRNFFIPLVLIILSNPVWGIYKGKVFESIS